MNNKVIKLIKQEKYKKAQKKIQDKHILKTYHKAFDYYVWQNLPAFLQKQLLTRFTIHPEKSTIQSILQAFDSPMLPRAFCIAAIAKLEIPKQSNKVYQLIDFNPYIEPYHELITFDEDNWGCRRHNDQKTYEIFWSDNIDATEEEQSEFEYLLRCSISLNKNEKIGIIKRAKTLTKFQFTELTKVFQEEIKKFYLSSSIQQRDIAKLVKRAENDWQEIKKYGIKNIQQISLDKAHEISPKGLSTLIKEHIIGQDQAVKALSLALYYHKKIASALQNNKKSPIDGRIEPILLMGPTGSGKSFLIKKAAEFANLAFVHVDTSSLVSVGIKGYGINDALKDLIRKSQYNLQKAQTGIIYFDEIDKLLLHHDGDSILSQMLRVIEGSVVSIEKHYPGEEKEFEKISQIDTKNILFIFGGSFEMVQSRQSGFVTEQAEEKCTIYDQEFLLSAGIPKELVGRIEQVITLKRLSAQRYRQILFSSKSSPLHKYQQMLQLNGKKAEIDDKSLNDILKKAEKSPYGARNLNSLLFDYFKDKLYNV